MRIWDDPSREDQLVRLWNDGKSSAYIAEMFGISRSSVVGKVFRLRNRGIKLRGEADGRAARVALQHRRHQLGMVRKGHVKRPPSPKQLLLMKLLREAQEQRAIEASIGDAPPLISSVVDLEPNHCRFPIGDPKEAAFGFCGQERFPGLPYCKRHIARAYRAAEGTPNHAPSVAAAPPLSAPTPMVATEEPPALPPVEVVPVPVEQVVCEAVAA